MDRRRALKSIAAASGTAIVGSAVVSSPAFAYDAPTAPTGPVILAPDTITNQRVDIESGSFGTATCPMSAVDTSVTGEFVRWDASIASNADGASIQLRQYNGGSVQGHLNTSYTDSRGFRLRKRAAMDTGGNSAGDVPWRAGDAFVITLVARYTCVYSDSTERSIEVSNTVTVTKGSNGGGDDWAVS